MLGSKTKKAQRQVQRRLPRPRLHPRPERRGFTRKPDNIERLLMK
jgi:hypothetical protein